MPFGNRINNFAAILAASFIISSVFVSYVGMRISNKQVVEQTHTNQSLMIEQNKQLLANDVEMLKILHRIEARYLDGQAK
jgi:hypothetical protein